MVEVYSDLDSEDEEETYEEVYATPKVRVTPYTTDRREARERSRKASESQQEMRLRSRNVSRQMPIFTPTDTEEGTSTPKVKKVRRKIPRTPSAVDQLASYNVAEDILNLPSSAKLGQWLKYPDQRRNLANALKRAIIKETNNVDLDDEYVSDNDDFSTTAVRCTIQINHSNVQAILDSGAAISIIISSLVKRLHLRIDEPSKIIINTANGKRARALEKINTVKMMIGSIRIPITLQVIESLDENLLLGTDWFKRTKAILNFDEKRVKFRYLTKSTSVPITFYDSSSVELDEESNTSMDELIDVIEDLTNDQYEEEDLDERDIFYFNSEKDISDDESLFDYNEKELFTNPWDDNPAVFLAQTEQPKPQNSEWNIQEDLHVGPLDHNQQESFEKFIEGNKDICALSQTKIGHTSLFKHQIPTGDHEPIASPAYRLKDPA